MDCATRGRRSRQATERRQQYINSVFETVKRMMENPANKCREKSGQCDADGSCMKCNAVNGEKCLAWSIK